MRILYFHQHFCTPKGASGTRSYEFATTLIARGHQVTMVCGTNQIAKTGIPEPPTKDGVARGVVDGIDVIVLPVAYSNRDSLAKRVLLFAKFALRSTLIALREPCDLVFATSTPLTAAIPGIFAKWFRRKPFVFEVRDLWPELPRALGMKNPFLLAAMSLLEWFAYHAADALVGLSPGIVEGIKRRAPQKTPVTMIPNGCDLTLFSPELRREIAAPGLVKGDFVAGFTGAHGIANALDAALDAASVLKRRNATRIKLLFIGDGNRRDALVERARREGLDNCVFLPPVPKTELSTLTASLNCGMMLLKNVPAFYHGTSPNKFFDYIAAGIPVLNNYPGWLAGLITASHCGIVVPPNAPEDFADALIRLANSPDDNAAMRHNARLLASQSFAREKHAAAWCDFICAAAQNRRAKENTAPFQIR
ncbi:MAG: glycosyltransferase family 4 protein [Puniceicoccales bacterium]|jgi:glycosyltransferase involved in cell wall biosynthesis|nr:glycosyltransferase family 4 protein [Puniceicoccales bacterium]